MKTKRMTLCATLAACAAVITSSSQAAELLSLFDFDEATAAGFSDSSTAGVTPTIVGGVTATAGGYEGGAANFDGTNIGITIPVDINPGTNPNLTIGGWVNAADTTNRSPWGHDNGGWDRGVDAVGGNWNLSNGDPAGAPVSPFDSGIAAGGGWQFVSATYSGNTVTLNVDGNIFTNTGLPGVGHTNLAIGSLNPGATTHAFLGQIDNFFIYDEALSPGQVEVIRANGIDAITQTNVAKNTWDFETGTLAGWNVVTTTHGPDNIFNTPGAQPAQTPAGDDIGPGSGGATIDASAQGDFYVRTWDGTDGGIGTADGHTGIIRSDTFVLEKDAHFDFLLGGGNHAFTGDPDNPDADITALTLEREVAPGDWEMIFSQTGLNENLFREYSWDASLFEGDTVRLGIYDTHQTGWGNIAVDNIRYSAIPEPTIPALVSIVGFAIMLRRRRK